MSNEWKELEIDKLPSDIITGTYEFQYLDDFNTTKFWKDVNPKNRCIFGILENQSINTAKYRYRRPEPKQPTHEEIMTPRFWQMDDKNYWRSITGVKHIESSGYIHYLIHDGWCDAGFFVDRKYSDLLEFPV